MEIMELSEKMEADLLESNTSHSSVNKSLLNHNFSTRRTRSQSINEIPHILEPQQFNQLQIKKNNYKVDEIERIYLNQKPKVVHKNLETIFEDPIWKKGSTILLGKAKVKRSIYLDREFRITSKQKSKSRKMKIKRLGMKKKMLKISNEEFKNKMMRLENYLDEPNIDECCGNTDYSDAQVDGSVNEDCNDLEERNNSE